MTEVQRAKAVIKIDILEKEKTIKEGELASMRSMHSSAWSEYGSELCAGGMLRDENEKAREIDELNRKITYLKDCLWSDRDLNAEMVSLEGKIYRLKADIETLKVAMVAEVHKLSYVSFALKVCNGER